MQLKSLTGSIVGSILLFLSVTPNGQANGYQCTGSVFNHISCSVNGSHTINCYTQGAQNVIVSNDSNVFLYNTSIGASADVESPGYPGACRDEYDGSGDTFVTESGLEADVHIVGYYPFYPYTDTEEEMYTTVDCDGSAYSATYGSLGTSC